jgi:hypothetical protein
MKLRCDSTGQQQELYFLIIKTKTMTKILEEVKQLSADALAKKQETAKNNYPKLLEQIKSAAKLGKTSCDFMEYEIDECSKRLLQADGFRVWATTKLPEDKFGYDLYNTKPKSIFQVSW